MTLNMSFAGKIAMEEELEQSPMTVETKIESDSSAMTNALQDTPDFDLIAINNAHLASETMDSSAELLNMEEEEATHGSLGMD